ncbi:MAG: lipopolysaccharide biosynthesis protein [Clostridium sp.]|nr:lipopolysaccharide biosynthesis protein [Clostridium sp.]
MEDSQLKQKTARGLLWGGIGNGALQVLNLFFGIFLSRLLSPADYGVIGALTIFSAIAGIFADSGFVLAIVNKKRVTDDDYNAVFWFNIVVGSACYWILFFLAPLIARFYNHPEMVPLSRFLFISFMVGSFSCAPSAYFFRNLMVRQRSQIQIAAIAVSGVTGIACAYNGWGYWGLAVQTVLYSTLNALMLWWRCPWMPRFSFKTEPLREMLPFSVKQLLTTLFTHVNNNIFAVLLGRFYTMRETGIYTQGNKWTTMGYSTIFGMINSVGQPVLREASDERERLRRVFLKLLRFTAFVSFPAMLGLAITSRELILLAITAKWLDCVPVMQILCIWGAFYPISTLYANLFNSQGRPGVYMWNTIALGMLQLLCLLTTFRFGLMTMLTAYTTLNIAWLLVWQYFARQQIGLRLADVLRSILPYAAVSAVVMAVAVAAASFVASPILSLLTKIGVASGLYLLAMRLLNSTVYRETIKFLLKKKLK